MRILYIWDADYPWDVRVEKICMSLKENGHEVHIAARNLKKLSEYENINGLYIHRLKNWKNNKVNYALSFPAFFSPIWKRFLDSIIHNNEIDLIVVRDLPMAIAGIWAGKRNNIPVIFDMAEDYISMLWDIWEDGKFQGVNLLVRNPYLARFVEKYTFQKTDHILVVVEEAKNLLLKAGVPKNKITIVSNTPSLDFFNSNNLLTLNKDLRIINRRYSAIYTGGIQMGRGIQTVLESIPRIIKKIPDFLFVVVGDGYASDYFKKYIKVKKLQEYVLWVGWVEHKKIIDYIKASKFGLIPHIISNHVNTTIPNKIFDYMGIGLPVISSNAIPLKRILKDEQCGITYSSGDIDELAKAIIHMHKSNFAYGRNGKEAVKKKYNWESDSVRLLKTVNSLI